MLAAALIASASIFHGTPVPPDQAPWLVTLTTRGPFCGGALIAPDRVLTAAHCVPGADPDRVRRAHPRRPPRVARRAFSHHLPRDPLARGTGQPERLGDGRRPRGDRAQPAGDGVPPLPLAQPAAALGEATLTVGNGRTGPDGGGGGPRAPRRRRSAATAPRRTAPTSSTPTKHLCTLDATANASQACAGDSGSPVMVRRNGAGRSRASSPGAARPTGATAARACRTSPNASTPTPRCSTPPGRTRRSPSGGSACGAPARRAAACSARGSGERDVQGAAGTAWPSRVPRRGHPYGEPVYLDHTGRTSPTPRAASAAR